jgi:DNA (cytosine-5)-methyltransferase 1
MALLTCIDAFCGAGGLSLGLQRAGFNVFFSFDNDKLCIESIHKNPRYFTHQAIVADVRSVLSDVQLKIKSLKVDRLDLLAGGPPCQGFSSQRTIGSDDDPRNSLVHDYGDLIVKVSPRFFLLENVVGIGGRRGRLVLSNFCGRMARHGYHIHQRVLDARDYGVPQRRRRVFVIGELPTGNYPRFTWPAPRSMSAPTVKDTIGHLPAPPEDGSEHPNFPGHRADRISSKNRRRLQYLTQGQARTQLPDELLANCHRASADRIGHRNVYGRMAWDDVAPTITARFDSFTRGKFGHPEQLRTISLLEGALLQTFPEDYRFAGNKVEVARQIGNAVPPVLAAAIGSAIREACGA